MADRSDKIEKLRRLAESDNPHEAARAREAVARLSEAQSDPIAAEEGPRFVYLGHFDGVPRYRQEGVTRDPAYPHQLPGAIRIPTPLGRGW